MVLLLLLTRRFSQLALVCVKCGSFTRYQQHLSWIKVGTKTPQTLREVKEICPTGSEALEGRSEVVTVCESECGSELDDLHTSVFSFCCFTNVVQSADVCVQLDEEQSSENHSLQGRAPESTAGGSRCPHQRRHSSPQRDAGGRGLGRHTGVWTRGVGVGRRGHR